MLQLREGPFLLTAAHNLDWNKFTTLYLGVNMTETLVLDAFVSKAPGGVRDDDRLDFAIARLPDSLLNQLGPASLIAENDISRSVADTVGRTYTCLGYPNSKNRTPPRFATTLKPALGIYTSNGVPTDRLGTRADVDTHILIDYNFKFSRDENGVRVNSIKPNGFSGGAVIDLGRLSDPATLDKKCNPKLIAMLIEAHRGEKAMRYGRKWCTGGFEVMG